MEGTRVVEILRTVAVSLAILLIFAAISAFVPQYFSLVVVLYVITSIGVSMALARVRGRKVVREVSGKTLVRMTYAETTKLMAADTMLSKELSKQMSSFLLTLLLPLAIWMIIATTVYPLIIPPDIAHRSSSERFLRYLVFYGMLWGLMIPLRFVVMPKKMVIPLVEYVITDKGIASRGIAIMFPLDAKRYELYMDLRRGFVEIFDKRSKQAYRLYHPDPEKLFAMLSKYVKHEER